MDPVQALASDVDPSVGYLACRWARPRKQVKNKVRVEGLNCYYCRRTKRAKAKWRRLNKKQFKKAMGDEYHQDKDEFLKDRPHHDHGSPCCTHCCSPHWPHPRFLASRPLSLKHIQGIHGLPNHGHVCHGPSSRTPSRTPWKTPWSPSRSPCLTRGLQQTADAPRAPPFTDGEPATEIWRRADACCSMAWALFCMSAASAH